MAAPNPVAPAVASASAEVPPKRRGSPLPDDKFVKVGRCASTGREISICYRTVGNPKDPCLLLVMGLGGCGLQWGEPLVQRFVSAGFYVVCYDNRDVGLSTHLDGCPTVFIARMVLPSWASLGEGQPPYTLYDMAEDGMNLLTALGIEKAHILGESMGGMIVQCMALRHPERVKSLTIVYSHSGGPKVKPQTFKMSLAMLREPASNSLEDQVNFKVQMTRLFTGDYELDEEMTRKMGLTTLSRCPEDGDGVLRQIWAVQRAKSRVKGLRNLRGIPTLIVHGMADTMVPFENGLQLARLVDGSKLVSFARMGHSLPKDLYDDIVAEVVLQRERGEAMHAPASAAPSEASTFSAQEKRH
ncbi:putative mitochondrial hydrolase, alpha/beta fold family-like protein [Leptomonas pyrrhocoris]|uniref:Putative mitochondrial hydrolase, alpha/beta fold family-like protein n=1 Tax=Leptomonas pyrrhocoris TaxID=157538 RepID=A0A0M9FUI6_LEPPY|nr:putative mitochondrial hydrolase, alpha/beta fold family-like protein [Leptomonas pyrrhocoris]KPA76229.1 putative mitochondrial hydrolase, alpha/beta fold family-like protein [Leptomonas pyrrhocoris]|eukprot:XP_015654668.1 putative mitochondrial hydrolase, alpha/beta fold family-like protein [Leptomonas pyrrhocoris]